MNYHEIYAKVQETLSEKRFMHSIGVVSCAEGLAEIFDYNIEKARIAAITHDYAKELSGEELISIAREHNVDIDVVTQQEPKLLHGSVGAILARRDLDIKDEEILNAISCHTTGRANMTILDKIIYLADVIEDGRTFYPGLENTRSMAQKDLNKAMLMAIDKSIHYIVSIKSLLHPMTIEARNWLILEEID